MNNKIISMFVLWVFFTLWIVRQGVDEGLRGPHRLRRLLVLHGGVLTGGVDIRCACLLCQCRRGQHGKAERQRHEQTQYSFLHV